MLFLVAISVLGGYFLRRKKSKYLQEAGLSTLVGIVGSFLLYVLNVENTMKKLEQSFVSLFMIILLPPIIFERLIFIYIYIYSGFNLQKVGGWYDRYRFRKRSSRTLDLFYYMHFWGHL